MSSDIDNHFLSQLISDGSPTVDWLSFSSADWLLLFQTAQRESVGPLLYWRLSKSGKFASLPEEVQDTLRAMYVHTRARNQKIFRELDILSQVFHEARIPVVVLKGACFALTIYPDIGLRPMTDLDILVPIPKLSLAVQLARSLGYQDLLPEASPGLHELMNHHVCLHKPGKQYFPLEIHRNLVVDSAFTYAVSVDWFWAQTEPFKASFAKSDFDHLLMLTPAAQLLYAASHSMLQHGVCNSSLRWYYDLDRLIRTSGSRLDWDLLLAQAQKFEWGSALKAALSQTHDYFDTPVPEAVHISLSGQADRLEALVIKKRTRPATHTLAQYQRLLSLRWYARVRLIWSLLFPSAAYMCWLYKLRNPWILPVWYLVHWARILKSGIYSVVLLVQGKARLT